jgi:neutral ceramidase
MKPSNLVTCGVLLVLGLGVAAGFKIGTGQYDITGPAAEVGMMGYAMTGQITYGLHLRLRARAFIFQDGNTQLTFVNMDLCMGTQAVKTVVIEKLTALYGPDVFTDANVMLSGTHTHAGPGGYDWHPMYLISTLGFHADNFNVIVNGIVIAIQKAYKNVQAQTVESSIAMASSILMDSNINRSPTAYQANPAAEKARYKWDTDKDITVLKLSQGNKAVGSLAWFPVHGTSMSNTNGFISGDNKGYAEYAFERFMNGNNTATGTGSFISAFVQTNSGDVSPNTRGAFCDDGQRCEVAHSTCGGWSEGCHGYGPGRDEFQSTELIGNNQFQSALNLFNTAKTTVAGPLGYVHSYVDMENVLVQPEYTGLPQAVSTCKAGLGDAFAGGTTDGPGEFNFQQGVNDSSTNAYWNWIAGEILAKPPADVLKCQFPKPILLYTGGLKWPAEWTQGILPLQMYRIGDLFIIGIPGEYTTMSGRRLRESVRKTLVANGYPNATVIISALANAYSHYVATPEEFTVQRYEGASTLFGPNTLPAYLQEYNKLALLLIRGQQPPPGPTPPDIRNTAFTLQPGVVFDEGNFGQVQVQPLASYSVGKTVTVMFVSASPRNNFRTNDTFLLVERQVGANWVSVANDGDWSTRYRWARDGIAGSLVTINWAIPASAAPGTYRIRHFGNAKDIFGYLTPFVGATNTFLVTSA